MFLLQVVHSDEFKDIERCRERINSEIDEVNREIKDYVAKKKEVDKIIVHLKSIQMVHF